MCAIVLMVLKFKTMRTIAQIFVAFSEKLNFIGHQSYVVKLLFLNFWEAIIEPFVLLNKELPFSGELPANSNKDHLKTWINLIKASKSTQVFLEVQFGKSFHLSWLPIYDLIGEFSKVGPYKHGIIHTEDWCLFSPIKTKIKKNEKAPRLPDSPK